MKRWRTGLGAGGAIAALVAALASPAGPAVAAGGPVNGPGTYYLVRSQATGNPAKADDNAKCDAYLGFPHNLLTIERLDAVLNAPVVSTATGEITNGVAAPVTPAYLCGAVGGDGGLSQSYARTSLPGVGPIEVAGPCDLAVSVAQLGSALADCRLATRPGSPSGTITTNSVLNPLNETGAQTGSLITGYFPAITPSADGAPASAAPAPVKGTSLYAYRDGGSSTVSGSADCPSGWRARTSTLTSARITAATGQVGRATGPDAATLTVCYEKQATAASVNAKAVLRVGAKTFKATGVCRNSALTGLTGSLAQNCALWLNAPFLTVQDGLLTGNLLVPPGDSAGTADSGVWAFANLYST